MNKIKKKIIAREFLFLLASIIIFFIAIAIWSWRYEINSDYYRESQNELNEMIENDTVSYRVKVFHYIQYEEPFPGIEKLNEFVQRISQDDVSEFYYNIIYDRGLITKDINHFRRKLKSDKEFNTQSKKYEKLKAKIDNRESFTLYPPDNFNVAAIIFSLLFGLRYIIYSTLWSIKQFKE